MIGLDGFTVVIESAGSNDAADLSAWPGRVGTGAGIEAAKVDIRQAIAFHLAGLAEDGVDETPAWSDDQNRIN